MLLFPGTIVSYLEKVIFLWGVVYPVFLMTWWQLCVHITFNIWLNGVTLNLKIVNWVHYSFLFISVVMHIVSRWTCIYCQTTKSSTKYPLNWTCFPCDHIICPLCFREHKAAKHDVRSKCTFLLIIRFSFACSYWFIVIFVLLFSLFV